jgi:hypothetical protein
LSKTGSQVVKALTVLKTPPPASPTYATLGLFSTTAMASTRPPMTAGPISRNFIDASAAMRGDCAGSEAANGAARRQNENRRALRMFPTFEN